jgi:hypothetical protein
MGYHASSKPRAYSSSVVVTRSVRASVPYGDGIGAGAYGSTTGKHYTWNTGFSPALARDVRLPKAAKGAPKAPKVRSWVDPEADRLARERRIAGTIGNVE